MAGGIQFGFGTTKTISIPRIAVEPLDVPA